MALDRQSEEADVEMVSMKRIGLTGYEKHEPGLNHHHQPDTYVNHWWDGIEHRVATVSFRLERNPKAMSENWIQA